MEPAPIPAPVQAYAPDFARRFGLIMAALVALIARRFLREPRLAPLVLPLCNRLSRLGRRFARLLAGLAAGTPPKPRAPGTPPSAVPDRSDAPRPSATALPTGKGWLIRTLGYEAAGYASQLEALLAEPGAAELLALAPTAQRLLNPLKRLLALGAFAFRPRPARAAPLYEPSPYGKFAFRSHGYTWYEVPTPPLSSV